MQWRRRHCCTCVTKVLYLLSLLGLVFLLHQVQLPQLGLPRWRGRPAVYGGEKLQSIKAKSNVSSKQSTGHFDIILQPTFKVDTDSSSENISLVHLQEPALNSNITQPQELVPDGPFPYVINEPHKCSQATRPPFLVLLIATEARQVEARNAIRQTWGNERVAPGFIRLFLLGKTEGELGRVQQKTLKSESQRHHDIIQQDFVDAYTNLTVKTMMGMNWVAKYCPHTAYVMKTDSDMFVNTEYLIHQLLQPDLEHRKNYFTGSNMTDYAPNRNKTSKWYMPPESYPGTKYPTFCSGTGYVFSGDLAQKIYRVSLHVRFLHLEDVYVGVCLAQLGIEPTLPPDEFLFNPWRVAYSSCTYSRLITSHGFNPNELLKYWHHLQTHKHKACTNTPK